THIRCEGFGVWLVGDEWHQVDLVATASAEKLSAEFLEVLEVSFTKQHGVEQVLHAGGFQRVELGPLLKRELQLIAVPDLEDQDFVMRMAEVGERLQQRRNIAKAVGDD